MALKMKKCRILIATSSKVTTKVTLFAMATVQILLVFKGKYKAKNFSMHMTARMEDDHPDEKNEKKFKNLQSSQVKGLVLK